MLLSEAPAATAPRSRVPWAVAFGAVALCAVIAFGWWRSARSEEQPVLRVDVDFGLDPTPGSRAFDISPDGRNLAFVAGAANRKAGLYTRRWNEDKPRLLAGGSTISSLAFSPDSKWIAFIADQKVSRVPVEGGPVLSDWNSRGGFGSISWGENGEISAQLDYGSGATRIPIKGGALRPVPGSTAGGGVTFSPAVRFSSSIRPLREVSLLRLPPDR